MPEYTFDPRPKGGGGSTRMPPVVPGLVADMKRYLLGRRLDYGVATHNGWYPSNKAGDDLPRIVIPGTMRTSVRGPFWQARTMCTRGDARGCTLESPHNHMVGGEPRYQSPGGERNGAVIVVLPYATPTEAVLVEGPMDALVAAMHGRIGIAVMGNSPGPATLETVARVVRPVNRLVLVPDLDSPGSFAAAMGTLAAWGMRCRIVIPPRKDLAACDDKQRRLVLGV